MMGKTISVSFQVWQVLIGLLQSEADTLENVLRRTLNLDTASDEVNTPLPGLENQEEHQNGDRRNGILRPTSFFYCNGGRIPVGTQLRGKYQGQIFEAKVTNDGIEFNGRLYRSPSGPACEIVHGSVNGWTFWDAKIPGGISWIPLTVVRDMN